MKIISVQVGMPKDIEWMGKTVHTGIYKESVSGPISVDLSHLEGDGQGDLKYHGGQSKAVYSYAGEHYSYWHQLRGESLPWGVFGENLTTEGLDESDLCVGDRLRFGEVVLEVTEPRMPCSRLGLRFQDNLVIKQFMQSGRSGVYYQVIEPGKLQKDDSIEWVSRHPGKFKLSELFEFKAKGNPDLGRLKEWLAFDKLESSWREWMQKRVNKVKS